MPIELGALLKLLGGAPHLKAGSFIAENLPVVKLLNGGQMSDLLAAVLRDGPGAVMQNPIAADVGRLQDAIEAAIDVLASTPGGAALVSAITGAAGLRGAVSGLSTAADLLSGVAMPGDGQFGLLDVATHTSVTDMLGDDMPATMGLDRVLGPLRAGPALAETAGALADVIAGVASGALGVADAVAWVGDQTAALAGVTAASATALQSAQDAALAIASISAVAATLAVPSDPALRSVLPLIVPADALAEMSRAAASHRA